MASRLVHAHGFVELIRGSDSSLVCAVHLNQQGAAASQPLSVAIPPEPSLTPVIQDFTDPNLFYLPAYYYGCEEHVVIIL